MGAIQCLCLIVDPSLRVSLSHEAWARSYLNVLAPRRVLSSCRGLLREPNTRQHAANNSPWRLPLRPEHFSSTIGSQARHSQARARQETSDHTVISCRKVETRFKNSSSLTPGQNIRRLLGKTKDKHSSSCSIKKTLGTRTHCLVKISAETRAAFTIQHSVIINALPSHTILHIPYMQEISCSYSLLIIFIFIYEHKTRYK